MRELLVCIKRPRCDINGESETEVTGTSRCLAKTRFDMTCKTPRSCNAQFADNQWRGVGRAQIGLIGGNESVATRTVLRVQCAG